MESLVSAKNIVTVSKHKKKREKSEPPRELDEEIPEEKSEAESESQPIEEPAIKEVPMPRAETFGDKLNEVQQEYGIEINTEEDEDEAEEKQAADNKLSKDVREIVAHFKGPKKIVPVTRKPEIAKSRKQLPIILQEQDLIDVIESNAVTVISGETGSGKSTQIPQFLYEQGYSFKDSANPGQIGITQPRRIAAVSLSQRVAEELHVVHGREVGYQIRHDAALSSSTQIKVSTCSFIVYDGWDTAEGAGIRLSAAQILGADNRRGARKKP